MKLGLVEGWRNAWKWASIRLAAVASAILAYLWAAPDVALSVLNSMPPEVRAYLSPIVGIAIFALVTSTRLFHKKPPETPNGQ